MFKYLSLHQKQFPINILKLTLGNINSLHKTVTYYLSPCLKIPMQNSLWYLDIGKLAVFPATPITRDHTRNLHLGQFSKCCI